MALFSAEHVAAIAATALAALLLVIVARRVDDRAATRLARALAVLIVAGFVVEHATYLARGTWTVRVNLPLQLSDAVTLVAIAALWMPRTGLLTELVYFWALSASLQAVLTPDL
ncbi:MAG: YwaF family protein, partial [Actinobacteria bacterium]|nr:YwaF family protein [Actinomycetota bacterium]